MITAKKKPSLRQAARERAKAGQVGDEQAKWEERVRRENAAAQFDEDEKRDAERRANGGDHGDASEWSDLLGDADTRPDLRNTTLPSGIAANDPSHGRPAVAGPRAAGSEEQRAKSREPSALSPQLSALEPFAGDDGPIEDLVPIDLIDVSPYQPREDFDQVEIEALAADMQERGQKDACNGRWVGERVQLTDGERRLRAARLLGWGSLRVRIGRMDDREAERDAALGNVFRQDLNPLELAAAYRHWLRATGRTQQDLAQLVKRDQGTVSHTLRLLELPEWARQEILARRMSASHAREIAPWLAYAAILKGVAKEWRHRCGNGGPPSLDAWSDAVLTEVAAATEPLEKPYHWDHVSGLSFAVKIEPTAEERAELGIVEIKARHRKTEERCTNATLHKKLWDAAVAEARKKAKSREKPLNRGSQNRASAKPPTPAERKKRDAEQAKQFAKRLRRWKQNWLAYLVAPRLNGSDAAAVTWRIVLYLATCEPEWGVEGATSTDERRRRELWEEIVDPRPTIQERRAQSREPDGGNGQLFGGPLRFAAIRGAVTPNAPLGPDSAGLKFLRGLLWDGKQNGPARLLPGYIVEAAAEDLAFDLAATWAARDMQAQIMAGPLTESYFELHSKEQLAALGQEWGVFVDETKPKATMIAQLRAGAAVRPLPRELGGGKKVSRQGAKAVRPPRAAKKAKAK